MANFIIFANPRTGSTSLAKTLAESPDVKMCIEPFHENYSKWNPEERNYSTFIKDTDTMNVALNELFTKFTAIKVLAYQLPKEAYFAMLSRKDLKILFLRRKNLLDAAVSNAVAHQVGEWHKQDDETVYDNLKPIDVEEIKEWVEYSQKTSKTYEVFLEGHKKGEYLPLFYEYLYSDSFDENRKKLTEICEFSEIAMPPDEAIKKHMMPVEAKINYKDIYKKIPNYEELTKLSGDILQV